jgi:hypothetical protein
MARGLLKKMRRRFRIDSDRRDKPFRLGRVHSPRGMVEHRVEEEDHALVLHAGADGVDVVPPGLGTAFARLLAEEHPDPPEGELRPIALVVYIEFVERRVLARAR